MDPQATNQSSAFDTFIDGLIEQKFTQQGHTLSPEVRAELRKDIVGRLDEFIMARVIAALSDDDVAEFEKLLNEGKQREDLQKFASEHIPDFTNFLTNTLIEFQKVYSV